jgi:uncharacterized lipoprotein YbaY
MAETVVRGEIVFDEPPDLPAGAVIKVTLRDAGLADAPSRVVAEQVMEGDVQEWSRLGRVKFAVPFETPDERVSYALSVHVDAGRTGRFNKGDYINMQSYPVSAAEPPDDLSVVVKRIKA